MAKIQQSGSVSIFSVIFAALLLGIVTIGFVRLMVIDQQQATTNDLSQSAYDAALAGVEDAKRVVRACHSGNENVCDQLKRADDCRIIQRSGVVATSGAATDKEVLVVSSSTNGKQYDQAYTCANITMDTEDYLYEAKEGRSHVIPLQSKQNFNTIKIEWFTQKDIEGSAGVTQPANSPYNGQLKLYKKSDWGAATPPLMRAQVIPIANVDNFRIDDVSNITKTAFLYPVRVNSVSVTPKSLNDPRPSGDDGYIPGDIVKEAQEAICSNGFSGGYACRIDLRVDEMSEGGKILLHLTPLYNKAHVRVSLLSGDTPVKLYGIQPSVDVTGRAGNVFRRVEARLQLGDDFPYPTYALQAKNSLCKEFAVTEDNVVNNGSCRLD